MKPLLYVCLGLVLICIVASMVFHNETGPSQTAVTIGRIRECDWVQKRFRVLCSQEIEGFLRENETNGLSLGQIFYYMVSNPHLLPSSPTNRSDLATVKDGWGRPLNFCWHNNSNESMASELLEKRLPILIWSSGHNASNEYGKGDDIFIKQEKD